MHVLVLTNSLAALPSLEMLQSRSLLSALFSPSVETDESLQLKEWATKRGIPFFLVEKELLSSELTQFAAEFPQHLVLSFGFPWPVDESVLKVNPYRFYNVHFSLLPKYAGPAPVFWQVRQGDSRGGVSVHRIVKRLDAGPLISQTSIPLLPGESAGLYRSRLSMAAVPLVESLVTKYFSNLDIPALPQPLDERTYFKRPQQRDLMIDWDNDTAERIGNLVNACNPSMGGALTYFKQNPVLLVEVSPADGEVPANTSPGTIIYADAAHGVFVLTCDGKIMRLNVVKLREGVFSGFRLATIGFARGDCFHAVRQAPSIPIQPLFSHQ